MARKASLPDSIYEEDFVGLAKREKHAVVKLRLLAMSYLQSGKTFTEVAELVYVARQTLYSWLNRFEKQGILGLYDKPGRGNKPKLLPSQEEAFLETLEGLKQRRHGGRIRGCDILKMMEEKFNIHCTLNTVYHTLARLDYSWITGRSRHPQMDKEAQEAFKKTFHGKLKNACRQASL